MNKIIDLGHITQLNSIETSWGNQITWTKTPGYVSKIVNIKSNSRANLQFHQRKEISIYVMAGELIVWDSKDNNSFKKYQAGCAINIKPGTVYSLGTANKHAFFIEVSTNCVNDVIKVSDGK